MRPLQHAAAGAVAELLRRTRLSPGKIAFAWRAAVGPGLDRVTTVRLEGNVLLVDAAGAQWARELQHSERVVLSRLQALLGPQTIQRISIRTL